MTLRLASVAGIVLASVTIGLLATIVTALAGRYLGLATLVVACICLGYGAHLKGETASRATLAALAVLFLAPGVALLAGYALVNFVLTIQDQAH